MLLTIKNVTQEVIFERKMLKTKLSVKDRLVLNIFVIFLALEIIYL
jgi:hypothetical protein